MARTSALILSTMVAGVPRGATNTYHPDATNPGKVFSRGELLDRVWGYRHSGYEHTVNTHINRIRAKIEADPARPRRLVTVCGSG